MCQQSLSQSFSTVLTAALARFQTEVDGFCCTLRGESGSLPRVPSLPPPVKGSSHDLECCDMVLENREVLDHRSKYTLHLF